MAKDYIDYDLMERLSAVDSKVDFGYKIIKLGEEYGELSQAFLAYAGAKNASKSSLNGDLSKNVLEEACDVMNVAMDIINNLPYRNEEVAEMFKRKLEKWEAKQKSTQSGIDEKDGLT